MWKEVVLPYLQNKRPGGVILTRTLKTFGLTEARVDEMTSPLLISTEFNLGVYAKPDGIHLRLMTRAPDATIATERICRGETQIREILGPYIWGTDDDELAEIVASLLLARQLSIATMETISGGILASTLSEVLRDSGCYRGGFVATSEGMLSSLGIDASLLKEHGLASIELAEAMAEVVRRHLGADIGIGVTGIREPSGKVEGRMLHRIFISIIKDNVKRSWQGKFPGIPAAMRHRAMIATLFELRQLLGD